MDLWSAENLSRFSFDQNRKEREGIGSTLAYAAFRGMLSWHLANFIVLPSEALRKKVTLTIFGFLSFFKDTRLITRPIHTIAVLCTTLHKFTNRFALNQFGSFVIKQKEMCPTFFFFCPFLQLFDPVQLCSGEDSADPPIQVFCLGSTGYWMVCLVGLGSHFYFWPKIILTGKNQTLSPIFSVDDFFQTLILVSFLS